VALGRSPLHLLAKRITETWAGRAQVVSEQADHVMAFVERSLHSSSKLYELLVETGVFRRVLATAANTLRGERRQLLTVVQYCEKSKSLSARQICDEATWRKLEEEYEKSKAKTVEFLNKHQFRPLVREGVAGEATASATATVQAVLREIVDGTCAFPYLATSLLLNDPYTGVAEELQDGPWRKALERTGMAKVRDESSPRPGLEGCRPRPLCPSQPSDVGW
jgi:hypothetical protein